MTTLNRVRVALTGFPGGPGVATFYALDTLTFLPSLQTLWDNLRNFMPLDVAIQVQNTGDQIDSVTGNLTGAWAGAIQPPLQGTNTGSYAAPAGFMIDWKTTTILDGHRVRGRTFIVPAAASEYDADGSLKATTVSLMQPAITQFILEQSNSFVIWHRPFPGAPAVGTKPARPAHVGGQALVTTGRVPDKVIVLRSRRD